MNPNGDQLFVSVLVVTQGTEDKAYALKIKDPTKFFYAVGNKWKGKDGIEQKIKNKYKDATPTGNIDFMIKSLIDIFDDADGGLSIFKANDQLTSWSELIANDNPNSPVSEYIIEKPCNE